MEESKKINRKKKLPSIPSNYVTLLQLQERWMKGQEQKEKEKKEEQRSEPGEENPDKDQVNDEVAGRASGKNLNRRRYYRKNGKPMPKEEQMPAGFAVTESECVDQKKKREELNKKKKKKKKKKKSQEKKKEKEEKAGAEDEEEKVEVEGISMVTALPASVEKVTGNHDHALKQASLKARRVFDRRNSTRPEDGAADIGRRFSAMSMEDETITRDYRRYGRQTGSFNYRGSGNRELNRRYYGVMHHQRNEGMIWVKKEDVFGGNAGGIQTSVAHPTD